MELIQIQKHGVIYPPLDREIIFNDYYYVTSGYTYKLTVNTNVYVGSRYESITAYHESHCD